MIIPDLPLLPAAKQAARTVSAIACCSLLACGANPESDLSTAVPDVPEALEPSESLGASLSDGERCHNGTGNKAFENSFPLTAFTTNSTYDSPDCHKAYLVNLIRNRLVSGEKDIVAHGDTLPTTQSECEKMRLGVYVWHLNGSFLGSQWGWGSWSNNRCTLPQTDITTRFGLTEGSNYRIAASARRHNTAKDSGSNYAIRKIRFYRDTSAARVAITGTSRCWQNSLNVRSLTGYKGLPIATYKLFRKDGPLGSLVLNQTRTAAQVNRFNDVQIEAASGIEYTYMVQAVNTAGEVTPSSNLVVLSSDAGDCALPDEQHVAVLLAAREGESPFATRTQMRAKIFSTVAGAWSMHNYYNEVSYGQLDFAEHGTTSWRTVPSSTPLTDGGQNEQGQWTGVYHADYLDWVNDEVDTYEAANGTPDRWIILTNNAMRSNAGGVGHSLTPAAFVGGTHFAKSQSDGLAQAIHEVGHTFGLPHVGNVDCPGEQLFPDGPSLPTGFSVDVYAQSDVMGVKLGHHNALHKHVFGWIGDSDVVSLSLLPGRDETHDVTLYDVNSSSGDRLLEMRIGGDVFYADFRRSLGFNDPSAIDGAPTEEGVYVYWLPRYAPTCGGSTKCLSDENDAALFVPKSGLDPMATPDNPMEMPNRGLRVSMIETNDPAKVTVRVETGI